MSEARKSNIEHWKKLQDGMYFENHPCYKGITDFGNQEAVDAINMFMKLDSNMNVVVIGCGYGRESLGLAPLVRNIYGIDVNQTILEKAVSYLNSHGVTNFIPIEAEKFVELIPTGQDLVFSIVVMQHLTRDLVRNYFLELGKKLNPGGHVIVQFLDTDDGSYHADAPNQTVEPSISWSPWQLVQLARYSGLKFETIRTQLVTEKALWHWVHFTKLSL